MAAESAPGSGWPYKVSVIVPTWGRADRLLRLVHELAATTPEGLFELVVVDAGSTDATRDVARALFGDVQVERLEEPCSFARAANRGAKLARGEHLVFLGLECRPSRGWLEPLLAHLEWHPQLGAVGPALAVEGEDGLMAGLVLVAGPDGRLGSAGRYLAGRVDQARHTVAGLPWCAMALRRQAFEEVGGFDEAFVDGLEDLDLCLRLRQGRWAVVCELGSRALLSKPSSRPAGLAPESADIEELTRRWAGRARAEALRDEDGVLRRQAQGSHRLGEKGWGANVVGYLEAELGLGESARLVVDAIEAAGGQVATWSCAWHINRAKHPFKHRSHPEGDFPFGVNVICLNGEAVPLFAMDRPDALDGRYTVGMWHWELEGPPPWQGSLGFVDEIWAASEFAKDALASWSAKPVGKLPLAVPVKEGPPPCSREEAGLPEGFVFGFMCDGHSLITRKNPLGVVRAFCQAFSPGEGPWLVLKVINGRYQPDEMAALRQAVGKRPDIVLQEHYLPPRVNACWTGLVDCYVSLHHSEGFGLTLAEALAWGTPVIATAYSGNLDFMTPRNSFLVPWSYSSVPAVPGPYPPGAKWAEPDTEAAAELMRGVWEHPGEARCRAGLAREDLRRTHSPEVVAATVVELLSQAYERGRRQVAKRYVNAPRWGPGERADISCRGRVRVPLRLNLGAGEDRREGYVSVDLRRDVADVVAEVDRLPFPDGSACEILALDILEHLPASKTMQVLGEWRRALAPGGKLTLRVPNLEALAMRLLAVPAIGKEIIRNIYGGHRFGPEGAWDAHHTGWTPDLLHSELSKAGFLVMSDDKELNNTVVAMRLPPEGLAG